MVDNLAKRIAWAITIIPEDKDLDWKITDVDLAKILGTNKNSLAGYRRQKGLLKGKVIDKLISHYYFSPDWLFKNIGEPFPGARRNYPDVCGPETPLYDKDISDASYVKTPEPTYGREPQKINIDEAWGKTYKVLKSGTPYAVALYLNIQQFSAALDYKEELAALKEQVADLRRQVDRLTAVPTTAEQPAASTDKAVA